MYPATGGSCTNGQGRVGGGANNGSGGGGGAAQSGRPGSSGSAGNGGEGLANDITGVACVYGSGGGGGWGTGNPSGKGGTNAGDGGSGNGVNGEDAIDGFGGGGGGAGQVCTGGKGGRGIVVLTLRQPNKGLVYAEGQGDLKMNVPDGGAFLSDGEAKDFALLPVTNEYGVITQSIGYTIETRDETTGKWSEPVWHGGSAYSHTQSGTATTRITWKCRSTLPTVAYRDRFLETSAAGVTRKTLVNANGEREVAYVFSDPGQAVLLLKQPMTLVGRLVVAGGGGGGYSIGGGGGGGGVIADAEHREFAAGDVVLLTVGAGGLGETSGQEMALSQGGDSALTIDGRTQTAIGGGYGGNWGTTQKASGGGSGGGESMYPETGGSRVVGQGCAGGGAQNGSGGGGGATSGGRKGTSSAAGHGGEGLTNAITGVAIVYGSGGGGGWGTGNPSGKGGTNAGDGGRVSGSCGWDALDGFGGGGGGAGMVCSGGKGGNGTVILRFNTHRPPQGFVITIGSKEAAPMPPSTPRTVLCWGDSITEGMAMPTGCPYPSRLQELLGATYAVLNSGDGGEDAVTICARQGGLEVQTSKDFAFAEGQSRIRIGDAKDNGISTHDGRLVRFTQALGRQIPVNELTIAGQRYRIQLENFVWSTTASGITYDAWLERMVGHEPRVVAAGSPVALASITAAAEAYCQVILMGANGGWNNQVEELIDLYRRMIDRQGPKGAYLVVVPYWYGFTPEQEQSFRRTFGARCVLFREEAILRGLAEEGLTPTDFDRSEMAVGRVPPSLLYQNKVDVHMNEYGYDFLAKLIFEQGHKLGYW